MQQAPAVEPPKGSVLALTARGAGWMFAWRMLNRVLGLASTLILVRLLAPEDFGLFSLAFAVIATLEAVVAIGVEAQIIRARQTSRELYDTIFTIGVIRGTLMSLLMLAAAGPAAAFFNEPRLEAVMQVLALLPLIGSLRNVGVMEFGRHLDFGRIFRMALLPRLLQLVVTLSCAVVLQSYWALIAGVFSASVFGTVLTYVFHPYRPRFNLVLWRELIGISGWTWAMALGMALRDRTATFAVGRVLGPHDLGVFTVSSELASLPTSEVAGPISQAAMPGLAAALRSPDPQAAGDAFLRILGTTVLVTLPAGIGISLVAGPLVALVLGQRWLEAAPLIAIMGATWMVYSISMISISLLDAMARLRRLTVFILCGIAIRAVAVAILAPAYGLNGVAAGLGAALLLEAALITSWSLRLLRLRAEQALAVFWRPILGVAAMVALLWMLGLAWLAPPPDPLSAALAGAAASAAGAATYVGVVALLWWLCGRPSGAEADLLTVLRKLSPAAARLLPPGARGISQS